MAFLEFHLHVGRDLHYAKGNQKPVNQGKGNQQANTVKREARKRLPQRGADGKFLPRHSEAEYGYDLIGWQG